MESCIFVCLVLYLKLLLLESKYGLEGKVRNLSNGSLFRCYERVYFVFSPG